MKLALPILLALSLLIACPVGAAAREKPMAAPGPLTPLAGVLQLPEGKAESAMVIIPGSGPTDRDGNGPRVQAASYKLLAQGLSANGVASLRIDKRGMFGSAKAINDANAVTTQDYAADVRAWVAVLKRETGQKCVWLLGHSEGGLIALLAGSDPDVCGIILVSTPGRPMGRVLRDQLRANPANQPLLSQALPAIESLEAGKRVDTGGMHPALRALFDPKIQGFLIDVFALDPAKLIATYRKPVLVLQGARDLQVSEDDAKRLKQAAFQAELVIVPNANHVLKTVSGGDVAENLATYSKPELPLARGVIESITQFIQRNSR